MKLLREPLVQFFALGLGLLLVYQAVASSRSETLARRIDIGESDIVFLATNFQRQWQRPPTEDELRGLVQSRVREEVLYREALGLGLDTGDGVVRRRMVQKMELLSQDLATLTDPNEQELQRFFQERREEYRSPTRLSFAQLYLNVDRRGAAVETDALALLERLRELDEAPADLTDLGDSLMIPGWYRNAAPADVERDLGSDFAGAVFELEPGWHGPIASGFGLHVVYVQARAEGRIPGYDEIRPEVLRDFELERRDRAKEELYERLRADYRIEIDDEALTAASLNRR